MHAFYSDVFELSLPAGHRFPMAKYGMLRSRIRDVATELGIELHAADAATDAELTLVHHIDYVRRVAGGRLRDLEVRRIGFPWSPQLVARSRRSVGATIGAGRAALEDGVAVNLAGGTHHAFPDRGQGYCVFNDVAVAVRLLQAEGRIRRAVVIDCDVHQGNGTAAIFAGDRDVFTFSIHGDQNFPFTKLTSDLDVSLPSGADDAAYLDRLSDALNLLPFDDAECVFYLAGADPYEGDRLGRLRVSKYALEERDRMVIGRCRDLGIPVAIAMAGGYAPNIEETVDIHAATVTMASRFARRPAPRSAT